MRIRAICRCRSSLPVRLRGAHWRTSQEWPHESGSCAFPGYEGHSEPPGSLQAGESGFLAVQGKADGVADALTLKMHRDLRHIRISR